MNQPIAPADQKTRDFFLGGTAAEQDHVVLSLAQFANRQFVDAAQEMRLILDEAREGSFGELANGNRPARLFTGSTFLHGNRGSSRLRLAATLIDPATLDASRT